MIDRYAEKYVQAAEAKAKQALEIEAEPPSEENTRRWNEACIAIGFSLFRALLCQLGAEKRHSVESTQHPDGQSE